MFVVPPALSDPPGRYRITVTDILSAASAETAADLR